MGAYTTILLIVLLEICATRTFVSGAYSNSAIARGFEACGQQTDFCTLERSEIRIGPMPCCAYCSCLDSCYQKESCCPDIANASFLFRHSCYSTYYKNDAFKNLNFSSNYSNKSYEMVSTCADGKSCTIDHTTSVANVSLDDIVGVFSEEHQVIFQNRKCAECNGVLNVIRLSLVIEECSLKDKKNMAKEELRRYILDKCILFSAPFRGDLLLLGSERQCYTDSNSKSRMIDKCNVTGEWKLYDESVEEACLDKSMGFHAFSRTTVYWNIYCFMCNNPQGAMPRCFKSIEDPFIEFSDIMELNIDFFETKQEENNDKKCNENEMFDEYFDVCRPISCAGPRMASLGSCEVPFEITGRKAIRYHIEIDLMLLPLSEMVMPENITTKDWEAGELLQKVIDVLQIPKIECGAKSLKSGTVYWDKQTLILHSIYLEITVELREKEVGCSYDMIVATLDSVSKGEELMLSFSVRETSIDFIVAPDTRTQSLPTLEKIGPDIQLYQEQALSEVQIMLGIRGFYMLNKFTIPNILKVELPYICPHIRLDESDFCKLGIGQKHHSPRTHFFNNLFSINHNITIRTYIGPDGEQTNYYYICLNHYLLLTAKKGELKASSTEGYFSFILSCVSMVCTLLVFLFLCFSKMFSNGPMVIFGIALSNLFIAQGTFQFGSGWKDIQWLCPVAGIAVHYFWLSFVFSLNAYCLLVMKNMLSTHNRTWTVGFVVSLLYVYGLPALFIIANIAVTNASTKGQFSVGYGSGVCHINTALMRGLLFVLPILLTVAFNCVINAVVMCKIRRIQIAVQNARRESHYLSVYFRLLILSGLTWIFGFVHEFVQSVILQYCFTLFVGGQGILLFLSFICRKSFRKEINIKIRTSKSQSGTQIGTS